MMQAVVRSSVFVATLAWTTLAWAGGQLSPGPGFHPLNAPASQASPGLRLIPRFGPVPLLLEGFVLDVTPDAVLLVQTVDEQTYKELVKSRKATAPGPHAYPASATILVREYTIVQRIQLTSEWKKNIDALKRFLNKDVIVFAFGPEWGPKILDSIEKQP